MVRPRYALNEPQIKVLYVLFRAYLGWSLKSMVQKYLFIAISFYHNIVCKNILCELGLIVFFSGIVAIEGDWTVDDTVWFARRVVNNAFVSIIKVSISLTFYEQLLSKKVFFAAFMY